MQRNFQQPRAPGRCVCALCALSVGTPRRTAVVITGGWCIAQKKGTYIKRIPPPIEKKKRKNKGKKKQEKNKRGAEYRTRELRRYSLMVLPPTLQRHEFAQSIHATFLYPTARLPPLFAAVVVCRCSGGDYRWVVCCKKKRYIQRTPPPVPLAITPTFRPWTHTSDDSYIYQLSLVVATATVSLYYA